MWYNMMNDCRNCVETILQSFFESYTVNILSYYLFRTADHFSPVLTKIQTLSYKCWISRAWNTFVSANIFLSQNLLIAFSFHKSLENFRQNFGSFSAKWWKKFAFFYSKRATSEEILRHFLEGKRKLIFNSKLLASMIHLCCNLMLHRNIFPFSFSIALKKTRRKFSITENQRDDRDQVFKCS